MDNNDFEIARSDRYREMLMAFLKAGTEEYFLSNGFEPIEDGFVELSTGNRLVPHGNGLQVFEGSEEIFSMFIQP